MSAIDRASFSGSLKGFVHMGKLLFTLLLVLVGISAPTYAQSNWQSLTAFPAPTKEINAVAAGGKIYMFAGQGNLFTPLGLVYAYDPATKTWTKKKPMQVPAHHVAMVEYNGKIYAFGGYKKPASGEIAWEPINNSWEYDPAADIWKPLAPMPSYRGAASAAVVNGKIYVMGGGGVASGMKNMPMVLGPVITPNRSLTTVEEYDVASNTWRAPTTMPTPRNHFAVAAVNGKIYAIGGRMGSAFGAPGTDTEVVEEYTPATNMWGSEKAKMSTPRASMSWGVYNGRIVVIGGDMGDARVSATFRTAEAYDPATDQWSVLPTVPQGREATTGTVVGDTFYLLSEYRGYKSQTGERKESDGNPFDALRLDLLQ
jgi:N-acetylneuraminic acid mutarotase